jgi:hypothetical protein
LGPIEEIDVAGNAATVTVVGQRYDTTVEVAQLVAEGDYVVAGRSSDGSVTLHAVGVAYVPGVSPIGVKGEIGAVDTSLATVMIGGARLDYSAELATIPDYVPVPGQTLEVTGIQPLPQGTVIVGLKNDSALVALGGVDISTLGQEIWAAADGTAGSGRR